METAEDYHNREEWSYSQMKEIIEHGIDYAVANKKKMLPQPSGKSIDTGEIVHMITLGGEDRYVFREEAGFDSYRTKASREWRDEIEAQGKVIITQDMWENIKPICDNISNHPLFTTYLKGKDIKHEVELYTTINGVKLRSKADAIKIMDGGKALQVIDLKTTSKYDRWKYDLYYAMRMHYDLQASLYLRATCASMNIPNSMANYYFCVAETAAPYRVKFYHASNAFMESGDRKLEVCLNAIKEFGDKEPNFLDEEIGELGDGSI